MKIARILFPTDFSECSDAALEFASRLANESKALLLIVHVEEAANSSATSPAGHQHVTPGDSGRRENRDRLRHMRPTIATVEYQQQYLSGSPVAEILKTAEQEDADVIVIGSHGRTGLTKLLTGSVAEGVMRNATCPVLIVKTPVPVVEDVSAVVLTGPPG